MDKDEKLDKQFMTQHGPPMNANNMIDQFANLTMKSATDEDQQSAMFSKSMQSSSRQSNSVGENMMPGNKPLGSVEVKISDLKFYEMLG